MGNQQNKFQRSQTVQGVQGSNASEDNQVIFLMADWCGHCRALKQSGEIEKLSQYLPVYKLSDNDPKTKQLMKQLQSPGFPTIVIVRNGQMSKHSGPRTAEVILQNFL